MAKDNNVHAGHRERFRKKIVHDINYLDSLHDYELLEYFLFYALPPRDTNALAHSLIDLFGSFSAVMDAPLKELCAVDGMGEYSALLLKMLPALARRYCSVKDDMEAILDSTERAGRYFLPRYIGRINETLMMVCVDGKGRVLNCRTLFEGSVNSTQVSIRKIVTIALQFNASGVFLAHNHPGGIALPSAKDIETTRKIQQALAMVDVFLKDHLIVAENDYVSMRHSNLMGME